MSEPADPRPSRDGRDKNPAGEDPSPTLEIKKQGQRAKKSSARSPQFDPPSGQARYSSRRILGQGGMKKIEVVKDTGIKRRVAKATIHPDRISSEVIRLFNREARVTAALEHPHIVPIYDVGANEKGEPFFIMKFLDGITLQELIESMRTERRTFVQEYSLKRMLYHFRMVCTAIQFAHERGVLHLDLKPSNVHITSEHHVYVMDWGMSMIKHPRLLGLGRGDIQELLQIEKDMAESGVIMGSPGFMAPEQIVKSMLAIDERTDVYGLGGILYVILTGEAPIPKGSVEEMLTATVKGRIMPPAKKNSFFADFRQIGAICMKALSLNPSARHQSVQELIDEIDEFSKVLSPGPHNSGKRRGLHSPLRNALTTAGILVFALAIVFGLKLWVDSKWKISQQDDLKAIENKDNYPLKINYKRISSKSIMLNWTSTLDERELHGYQIIDISPDRESRVIYFAPPQTSSYLLTNLGPYQVLQMRPVLKSGQMMPPSMPIEVRDYSKMTGAINLTGHRVNEKTINLSWKRPPHEELNIIEYRIVVGDNPDTWQRVHTVPGHYHSTMFIYSSTESFQVRVRAVINENEGLPMSRPITIPKYSGPVSNTFAATPVHGNGEVAVLEAEKAYMVGALIGDQGTYVDFINNSGDQITWKLQVDEPGSYSLMFRYALNHSKNAIKSTTRRPMLLKLNGKVAEQHLEFISEQAGWENWNILETEVQMTAGVHELTLETMGYNGPNIDRLMVKRIKK